MPDKTCVRCQETLPVDSFSCDKRRPDGRFPYCKSCKNSYAKTCNLDVDKIRAAQRKHYLANRERYREEGKRPERLAAHRARHKERQAADAEYRENAIRRARKAYAAEDPEYRRTRSRAYKAKNRESLYWKGLQWYLPRKYGITLEEYEAMVESQNGLCLICGNKPQGKYKRLAVDHCHVTGKIRGLLCSPCNTAIGSMKESIEVFQAAINYLRKHST